MTDNLLESLQKNIELNRHQTIWVAFSGGMDSSALLFALSKIADIRPKLQAIHINHGLSPEANQWQTHCQRICQQLEIPFHTIALHGLAPDNGNLEAKARQARYQAFAKIANDAPIITGHHQQDQTETLLLNLIRGTGLAGLCGMSQTSTIYGAKVIRPWLEVSQDSIRQFCLENDLNWIEDESNTNTNFSRNHIRHNVLPFLTQMNPQAIQNIQRTASFCQASQQWIDSKLEAYLPTPIDAPLQCAQLLDFDDYEMTQIIRLWLKKRNLASPNEKALLTWLKQLKPARKDSHPQLRFGTHILQASHGLIQCLPFSPPINHMAIPLHVGQLIYVEAINQYILIELSQSGEGFKLPRDCKLSLEPRKGGETMLINGKTQKVKKLLQSQSLPIWQKQSIQLLYINNQLAVIPNIAIDDRYKTKHSGHSVNYLTAPKIAS